MLLVLANELTQIQKKSPTVLADAGRWCSGSKVALPAKPLVYKERQQQKQKTGFCGDGLIACKRGSHAAHSVATPA